MMIFVLLSVPGICPGCLQMPVFLYTDPYIFPCWWKYQAFDPVELGLVAKYFFLILVFKGFSGPYPHNAFLRIAYIYEQKKLAKYMTKLPRIKSDKDTVTGMAPEEKLLMKILEKAN